MEQDPELDAVPLIDDYILRAKELGATMIGRSAMINGKPELAIVFLTSEQASRLEERISRRLRWDAFVVDALKTYGVEPAIDDRDHIRKVQFEHIQSLPGSVTGTRIGVVIREAVTSFECQKFAADHNITPPPRQRSPE